MNWKHAFTSSIGKKLVMGITGVSLIAFLCVHCYVNSLVFFDVEAFDSAAHFLGTNILMHVAEVGLFGGLILHIVQGLMLYGQNKASRPVAYDTYKAGFNKAKWYSRSMTFLGILLLLFLVIHLAHFWAPNRYNQVTTGHELSLYELMQDTFSQLWVVIVYILGCVALGYHLMHGFWSATQTLGLSTSKYKPIIRAVGTAYSVVVPLIFILMPIAFYAHWV
ncbi:MAG: succinate dehydrogenase cytochrome b subunit [Edaphocola sp.]